jgi:threonine/homoserine/homoserine lactone efflux protein
VITATAIPTMAASFLLGATAPGPSFLVVARNAIGVSRTDGLATALGMGAGGVVFCRAGLPRRLQ